MGNRKQLEMCTATSARNCVAAGARVRIPTVGGTSIAVTRVKVVRDTIGSRVGILLAAESKSSDTLSHVQLEG